MWAASLSKKKPFHVVTLLTWFIQGVLNLIKKKYTSNSFSEACVALLRNTSLPLEIGFYRKCTVNICCILKNAIKMCVLFGEPGTLFYTEGTVLPLKKSPWSNWCFCGRGPTWRLFLRTLLRKALLVTGFSFPCLQRSLCILLLRPACQEDFCSDLSHAHPHSCRHVCARMLVCAHGYGQRAEKRALLAVGKMLGTVRTQPIQPENYSLTYESWILKVLIHLRMEILASPDLHIETYMTSFSDRLFFFPCLLKLAK